MHTTGITEQTNINQTKTTTMMKATRMMLMVAAATMLLAACGEKENTVTAGDNQLVYDGKVYQAESTECAVIENSAVVSCSKQEGDYMLEIRCNIENITSSCTYDLTKEDPTHGLFFHVFLQSEDLQNEEKVFDFQYQNAPHLWYFLNGDNVSGTSAFVSGTADATVGADKVTLNVNGKLVNGKDLAFRIVAPRD